jgi:hypothetical protein
MEGDIANLKEAAEQNQKEAAKQNQDDEDDDDDDEEEEEENTNLSNCKDKENKMIKLNRQQYQETMRNLKGFFKSNPPETLYYDKSKFFSNIEYGPYKNYSVFKCKGISLIGEEPRPLFERVFPPNSMRAGKPKKTKKQNQKKQTKQTKKTKKKRITVND